MPQSDNPDAERLREWAKRIADVLDEMDTAHGDFKPDQWPPNYMMATRLAWAALYAAATDYPLESVV